MPQASKTFRIALSHAINRPEVIERIYGEELEPYQPAPRRESPYFREQLATQYTRFDPTYANELLDKAGFSQRDADGNRLTASGRRIEFTLSATNRYGNHDSVMAAKMVAGYWQTLGISVKVTEMGDAGVDTFIWENRHDAFIGAAGGGLGGHHPLYGRP